MKYEGVRESEKEEREGGGERERERRERDFMVCVRWLVSSSLLHLWRIPVSFRVAKFRLEPQCLAKIFTLGPRFARFWPNFAQPVTFCDKGLAKVAKTNPFARFRQFCNRQKFRTCEKKFGHCGLDKKKFLAMESKSCEDFFAGLIRNQLEQEVPREEEKMKQAPSSEAWSLRTCF